MLQAIAFTGIQEDYHSLLEFCSKIGVTLLIINLT